MSHGSAMPRANQWPYPLQVAPHIYTSVAAADVPAEAMQEETSVIFVAVVGFIAASVFGAASLAAATMWAAERLRSSKEMTA